MTDFDQQFAGSVPALYEAQLVPMIFQPYAQDLGRRVASAPVQRLLEVAAGTGVLTRVLAALLPATVEIVATDLNQAMLDQAAAVGTARPVRWQQADAMALPFAAGEFDVVACQFGAMFFPDRAAGFAEARRVLCRGGRLLFNVWDRIETNAFAYCISEALASRFPADPPRFMARTPHGYHDLDVLRRDLRAAGFTSPARVETLALDSRAPSAVFAAVAYCQGTPWRHEIEARGPAELADATAAATRALALRFGDGPITGRMQAHVVEVHT